MALEQICSSFVIGKCIGFLQRHGRLKSSIVYRDGKQEHRFIREVLGAARSI